MDQIEQFQSTRLKLMKLQLQLNEQQEENLLTMVKILKASDNQRGGDQKEDAEESTDGEEKTKKAQQKKKRRWWVRKWIVRRPLLGQYNRLFEELKIEDASSFKNFLRMDEFTFKEILHRVTPRIQKQDTFYRQALEPGLKLALTLRYLASGDSYHSLMYSFRVPHNTISKVVREVCEAFVEEYASELIEAPNTEEQWRRIAEKFQSRWNMPHCLGALDGKHIAIKCPANAGSMYYNYKGFHSIILMGLVDANYKFLWVDVGSNGSSGDAQVFNASELKEGFEEGYVNVPPPEPLPGDDKDTPYYLVGDDAFQLRTWLMKPFSKRQLEIFERIFNYRLSRARRIVENAFGILSHRFRCLLTTLQQYPKTVESIVLACICLHNLLRNKEGPGQVPYADQEDGNRNVIPGAWRDDEPLLGLETLTAGNRMTNAAKNQREYLARYLTSDVGAVPWQTDMI